MDTKPVKLLVQLMPYSMPEIRGPRILDSTQGPRTLERTLSLRTLKKTLSNINTTMQAIAELIEKIVEIKNNIESISWGKFLSYYTLNEGRQNSIFQEKKYFAKHFYDKLLPILVQNVSEQLSITAQPRFQYKSDFMKLTTFSIGRTTENQTKLIEDSESIIN